MTISLVNYNHARYLPRCLEGIRAQTFRPSEVIISDNDSEDGSAQWLESNANECRVILNETNLGYAQGHNNAFRLANTEYVVALNCDVVLEARFLERMVSALEKQPKCGSGCGRLWLGQPGDNGRLDSTGLFPDRYRRFHDRDHDTPDVGQRRRPGYVFGPSGSAATYRKAMLEDVAIDGRYFDERLFAYCEDADLAWRAQSAGWRSMFVPEAEAWHIHDDMSRARSGKSDGGAMFRQMLLIRNRHLCLLKNDAAGSLLASAPRLVGYDVALEAYLLTSKPKLALQWPREVVKLMPATIRERRRVRRMPVSLSEWFDWQRERALG